MEALGALHMLLLFKIFLAACPWDPCTPGTRSVMSSSSTFYEIASHLNPEFLTASPFVFLGELQTISGAMCSCVDTFNASSN